MLPISKLASVCVVASGLIALATITSPFTSVFGIHYYSRKDFTCCSKNQLVLHHYYTIEVLWFTVADGYTIEKTSKASTNEGCTILCNE